MVAEIVVKIELGHIAQVRDVPNLDGHTHDWMVFVKGADGIDIEHFVEKVVFWLHESYIPSKYVVKAPPYEVKQTGYAGFNILINVHFKNKSEPKYVSFHYDMFLHMENMPPVNHTRIEMLTFSNPADDFKKKLLKSGGVLQNSDVPKDKKTKEGGSSDSKKHRTPLEGDKKVKISQKGHKPKSKEDGKRRNSVTEADLMKKKKIEEKLNSSVPVEKKPREKVNKIKIKIEKGQTPSLFSREESIDIKQIMKKEPSKKEDVKRQSEKRHSPPEIKVKKEEIDKVERFPEKKKKDKKRTPAAPKVQPEVKQKKRRTMSSSDTDATPSKRNEPFPSDSDSGEDRRVRKKHKKEKSKEVKKMVKKMKKERKPSPLPPKRDNTELMDMEICVTPPHESLVTRPETSQPSSAATNVKEKRHKVSKSREKNNANNTGSNNKEVFSNVSTQNKHKIERFSPQSRNSHKDRSSTNSGVKKNVSKPPAPARSGCILPFTSDSSSSESETDLPSSRQQVFKRDLISPIRSSSESPSPVRTPLTNLLRPLGKDDVISHTSDDAMTGTSHDEVESGSDGDLFEDEPSPLGGNHKNYSEGKKPPREISPPVRVPRQPSPLVTVSMGSEVRNVPGLNSDLFEQLKQLQNTLSQINDVEVMKKVASIVKKSGRFSMDGEAMDFDLCALDRKTIHKIQKHLKVH